MTTTCGEQSPGSSTQEAFRRYEADLHIHTSLSPCAEPEMTPEAILATARARGLSLVAICDHDEAIGCELVFRLATPDLCVIPGIEITVEDEKHVLGLFATPAGASGVRAEIVGPSGQRPSIGKTVAAIRAWGGLSIAAHVDRPASGILGRQGRLPTGVGLDALELSRSALGSQMQATLAALGFTLTAGSDSHCLEEIGTCRTCFELANPTFGELALAIRGQRGRRCFLA